MDTVVLDIDGTLVDSNYQHVIAWDRAFRSVGVEVELRRIHRAIGMGGEELVPHLAGDDVENRLGDRIRDRWKTEADALVPEVVALPGARDLLLALRSRGLKVVLATSGKPDHTEHNLDLLDVRDVIDHLTTSADVEAAKPAPDLLEVARDAVEGVEAVMIGDSVWDVEAARRAKMPAIGLLSGGLSREELVAAGAVAVYDDPQALHDDLEDALRRSTAS